MQYDVVCDYGRVVQYRLLRIEVVLFEATANALREWVSQAIVTPDTEELYYTMLGQMATANHRCLVRMNEIRSRLSLPPYVDKATYPVRQPTGEHT